MGELGGVIRGRERGVGREGGREREGEREGGREEGGGRREREGRWRGRTGGGKKAEESYYCDNGCVVYSTTCIQAYSTSLYLQLSQFSFVHQTTPDREPNVSDM